MKVLIIEDNFDHQELIMDALIESKGEEKVIEVADDLASGVSLLTSQQFDICLCDLSLPDSNIEQTIEWLCSDLPAVPIVVLTSLNNGDIAQQLLNTGVQDFIAKDELSPALLYRTCRYAIERWKHQRTVTQYNAEMQAFCSSLSHDFNAHISRVLGLSGMLKSSLKESDRLTTKEHEWFELMEASSKNVHQLTSDLQKYISLGYAQAEFSRVSLEDVLSQVHTSLHLSSEKPFVLRINEAGMEVIGSAPLLQIMFYNLFSNSIKFSENTPQISVTMLQVQDHCEISITDNGIGFDQQDVATVFRPFKRLGNSASVDGSGLGLSIVKRVIESHKGSIEVSSAVGQGSTFTLRLPMQ